jgi:hypothetical protein
MRAHQAGVWKATSPGTVHFTCDRAGFIASATSIRSSGALALAEPAGQVAAFYLTTIGVFSVDAIGAIENTSQVFQPDDRF